MIPPVRQLSLFLAVAGAVGVLAALGALFGSCASMRPARTAGPAGGDGVAAAPAIPTERLFEDAAAVLDRFPLAEYFGAITRDQVLDTLFYAD